MSVDPPASNFYYGEEENDYYNNGDGETYPMARVQTSVADTSDHSNAR